MMRRSTITVASLVALLLVSQAVALWLLLRSSSGSGGNAGGTADQLARSGWRQEEQQQQPHHPADQPFYLDWLFQDEHDLAAAPAPAAHDLAWLDRIEDAAASTRTTSPWLCNTTAAAATHQQQQQDMDMCLLYGYWRSQGHQWGQWKRSRQGSGPRALGAGSGVCEWTLVHVAVVVDYWAAEDASPWRMASEVVWTVVAAQKRYEAMLLVPSASGDGALTVVCVDCHEQMDALMVLRQLLAAVVPSASLMVTSSSPAWSVSCVVAVTAVMGRPRFLLDPSASKRAQFSLKTVFERVRAAVSPPTAAATTTTTPLDQLVALFDHGPDDDSNNDHVHERILLEAVADVSPGTTVSATLDLALLGHEDTVADVIRVLRQTGVLVVGARSGHLLVAAPFLQPGATVYELFPWDRSMSMLFQPMLGSLGVRHVALALPYHLEEDSKGDSEYSTWLQSALARTPTTSELAEGTRFLLFQPWEQLNNQLIAFRCACAVAAYLDRTLVLPYLGYRRDSAQKWNFDFDVDAFAWEPMDRYFDPTALLRLPCRTVSHAHFRAATTLSSASAWSDQGATLYFNPLFNHTTVAQIEGYYGRVLQLPVGRVVQTTKLDQMSEGHVKGKFGSGPMAEETVLAIGVAFWIHDFGHKIHYPYREYHDVMGNALYRAINAGMRPRSELVRSATAIVDRIRPVIAIHARVGQDYEIKCATIRDEVARARCLPSKAKMVERVLDAIRSSAGNGSDSAAPWSVYIMADQPTIELPFAADDPLLRRVVTRIDVVGLFEGLDPTEISLQEQAISTLADAFIGNIFSSFSRTVFEQRTLAARANLEW